MTPSNQEITPGDPGFSSLGLDANILEILTRNKFHTPTPIQHKAIPVAIEGKDIIGVAQTGTGKTLAFALPIIQQLSKSKGRALILLPTRELAVQVEETFRKIGYTLGISTAVLIGGVPISRQLRDLRNNPNVIVGTPGRIIDCLQQKKVAFHDVKVLVLDEADRMLDMGFAPQIRTVLETVPKARQTLLFSATMPNEIVKLAMDHMKLPIRVEIARSGTAAEKVEQEVFIIPPNQKMRLMESLLKQYKGTVLVFSRTKYGAKKICRILNRDGHHAAEIHSNRSFSQRQEAMRGFKNGKYRILVATDIASRGIDVKEIEVVINYDVPEQADDYIHRIGRTGRANMAGRAITFATKEQGGKIRQIERLMRMALKVSKLPELPPEPIRPAFKKPSKNNPPSRGSSYRGPSNKPYKKRFQSRGRFNKR